MTDLLATPDGIALVTAYTRVRDLKVRRAVIALVEQIVAEPGNATSPDVVSGQPPRLSAPTAIV